jgi:pimeloyl-ACP methyl ester carboxylesterase
VRAAVDEPRVRRLLLVAPPPALLEVEPLRAAALDVLLVAAERDAIAPCEALAALAAELPRARCAVIPEADHFFGVGLAALGRAAAEWLASTC